VKNYLCVRYGELPNPLSINCSDDPLWPVLVAFDTPACRDPPQHAVYLWREIFDLCTPF
jgi:hypothetical protein